MTHTQWGMILAIAVYLLGMIYIGYIYSKKTQNAGDFYLGGRKLGPFVTAMSAEASDMSGWLLMGLPGVALAGSIAEACYSIPEDIKDRALEFLDDDLLEIYNQFQKLIK